MTQDTDSTPTDMLTIAGHQYDLSQHTPMMVQYLTMKAQYPHALLLYRMGDFYELFFEDAKLAAQILDITLTRRGSDKAGNSIAMAGVPFHAADSYMARLIAAGQTVVVCEQVEAPSTPLANSASTSTPDGAASNDSSNSPSSKGIMHREVVRTLTAGTLTDDALIAPNQSPSVAAISMATQKSINGAPIIYRAAVSQLDLSAGKLVAQSLHAQSSAQLRAQLLTVLARFAPSEVLINERLDERWQQWLIDELDCPVLSVAAADFHPDHAPATLCQQFNVRQLDGLGIAGEPLIQTSCAALIHYARQTQQRQIPHVNQLVLEHDHDYLIIDAGSLRNLELFEPASPQGTALISVVNHCKTPMGKRLLQQQLKRPLRNRVNINQRLDAIEQLLAPSRAPSETLTHLQQTLSAISDIERISSRIGLSTAKPRDLKRLAESIDDAATLYQQLTQSGHSAAQAGLLPLLMQQLPSHPSILAADTQPVREDEADISISLTERSTAADSTQPPLTTVGVAALIHRAIVTEPPAHTRDGGMIAAGYDADFDRLTHLHDNIEQTLDDLADQARTHYGLPSLKVGFNKVSGFYLELPKAQAAQAPEHFIRRQTLKNSERFITDELKIIETEYLGAQSQALAREKQLYNELLTVLAPSLPALQQLAQAIAQIDVLINWAVLAQQYDWQRPVLHDSEHVSNTASPAAPSEAQPSLDIREGRHVVVEAAIKNPAKPHSAQALAANHFVANDCVLGSEAHPERLLLITGPNMGGKSTYMRQTALIVLLACCGSYVPAKSATIGDIDRIFTRIGSADDLAGGKSTFMVEMIETAHILNLATDKSLVLMDEVGRGTSTTDGLAIAHACVQQLVKMRCLTLFATHYFELTQLAQQEGLRAHIRNVHVAASEIDGQLLLLHQIKEGAASSSFGLHVAKMAGIPAEVLTTAQQYLTDQLQSTAKSAVPSQSPLHDNIDLTKSASAQCAAQSLTHISLRPDADDNNSQVASQNTNYNTDNNQILKINNLLAQHHPDDLTPKQAHDLLYQLKQIVDDPSDL